MALTYTGFFRPPKQISELLADQIRLLNLKPVKRISIKYDPFNADAKVARDFNSLILSKNALKTNLFVTVKTEVASDRSEAEILCDLVDGKKVLFKCHYLTTLEILQQMNKLITPLAPEETVIVETKIEKKKKK